jgi:hypothetical protein
MCIIANGQHVMGEGKGKESSDVFNVDVLGVLSSRSCWIRDLSPPPSSFSSFLRVPIAVAAIRSLVVLAFKWTSCSCCVWSCAVRVATSSARCAFCGESSALAFSTVDPVVLAPDEMDVSTMEVTEVRSLLSRSCYCSYWPYPLLLVVLT